MGKLSHDDLERFVTDTLSKREPCPAMVLAWGWALKPVCVVGGGGRGGGGRNGCNTTGLSVARAR